MFRMNKKFYLTLEEAKKATALLGIASRVEYEKRFKEDMKLPSNPRKFYSKEWPNRGGWSIFFGRAVKDFYLTFAEAQKAVALLNINSRAEYSKRYKEDPKLPSEPSFTYSKEWPIKNGVLVFLGKEIKTFYTTLAEAQQATALLGINTYSEYKIHYKKDPKLTCDPNKFYSAELSVLNEGKNDFFGVAIKNFYPTLAEAQRAVASLGITTQIEYTERYKEDVKLPSCPLITYEKELPLKKRWEEFTGKKINNLYRTLSEAQHAVFSLGITSSKEYSKRYKEDTRLPSTPHVFYSEYRSVFHSLAEFYVPNEINNFAFLVQAVKALNIKNSSQYRKVREKYKQLPSNPKRSFPNEFIDWYHLCDIPKPYSYSKLQRLVKINQITTIGKYNKWRIETKDPSIPSSPHENICYRNEWVNWYVFFGTEEPFQLKYLHEPYLAWRDEISEFMKLTRGGDSKVMLLCKFVRLYIKKYQLGMTPIDFVFNKKINFIKFREFTSENGQQSRIYNAVNELLDYIIRTKCSDEDPETGEIIRMPGAKNRIKGIWLPEEPSSSPLNETVKPALSYQYIQAIRNWTIPSTAKAFSDLVHLHKFDADWITVPFKIIDKSDPDCVFKIIDDEFAKIWIPTYWMHAFTLFSVPLRGVQIAYNDSGEADAYIPEYKNNKIVWVKNQHRLAGLTNHQGMIKRYPNNEFGMFSTSNKTSKNSGSQSVPWMPLELAYWLIKLRKWQSKYNSIKGPKAWVDCERTNYNEAQRHQKGVNCFLFRDFGAEECGTFGTRLAHRLAAALYFSQPKDIRLATCEGKYSSISTYKSEFTPHSMRVSLITIYVMEYNLDLSIIMKIAGHSSIIMCIYYVKTQGATLRKKIEEGEKRALKSQASATQSMIEQSRVEEVKANLVGNSEETLKGLNNKTPAGNYLFRDWGICPHAGSRCEDGGDFVGNTQVRTPVPTGYLGGENCVRCRHFITGPAFIGGLLAIFQEIILYLEAKQLHYDELLHEEEDLLTALEKENENEYTCDKNNEKFDEKKRKTISASIRKTKSEYEVVAKKMDMLYCDLGAVSTLLHQCQALLNQSNLSINNDETNLQLIVRPEHELQVIAEEVSQYELLCEVCENAEIYQSASAELAITPRTQLIDNMMLRNNLKPLLFTLTNKQQLKAGNQLNKLFKERLKSHVKVNDLIEGKLLLSDLEEHERIEPVDLLNVLHQQRIDIKEI